MAPYCASVVKLANMFISHEFNRLGSAWSHALALSSPSLRRPGDVVEGEVAGSMSERQQWQKLALTAVSVPTGSVLSACTNLFFQT